MSSPSEIADPTTLYQVRDGVYAPDLLIAAVVNLDLFTWIERQGPVTEAQISAGLEVATRPLDVLLTYGAALGLIERQPSGVISLTDLARQQLVADSPLSLHAYYASLAERPAVGELTDVLRTDRPAAWASARTGGSGAGWSQRLDDVEFARGITAAMDARGVFLGPALAAAVSDLPATSILDVGGSSGIYACSLLAGRPAARGTVVERPPVDVAARLLLAERGWDSRVDVRSGDIFTDPLPQGHDLHLYSQVLHDWDEPRVRHLLGASYAALPPGGWMVDHDAHIDADKRGPLANAEYSVLLMHSTVGKCWSIGELALFAADAGFENVSYRRTVAHRGALVAQKPLT
ncbi:putative O-methyltransferase YrrM [Antricoccus suffuscus]|uniref:Putative O-methyltransferase YrrM n=1 Tax=Antricoccus suffuscus TaxID=1629062 RepID=A0A2T1A2H5_9ACTN|nr:methyltransferase [Antricoccus suffuscus]PRZ42697.1 putative O-methyltransferase YrrM [Antricoccus suffuscus]